MNGYYRLLSASHYATRTELRIGYQGSPQGVRETIAIKVLLDSTQRRVYDNAPFGSIYVDQTVLDEQRRNRVLAGVGSQAETDPKLVSESVDSEPQEADRRHVPATRDTWGWSYYLAQSTMEDTDRLARWQELLITALASREESYRFAVGLDGGMAAPFEIRIVGYRQVAFLRADITPTPQIAAAAAHSIQTRHAHAGTHITRRNA